MFDYISMLFSKTLELFQIEYPGIGLTFLEIGLGSAAVVFALSLLGRFTGVSFGGSLIAALKGPNSKGGNNKNIKISKERSGDTH